MRFESMLAEIRRKTRHTLRAAIAEQSFQASSKGRLANGNSPLELVICGPYDLCRMCRGGAAPDNPVARQAMTFMART